jgi:type IV pilus assembly protein PilA
MLNMLRQRRDEDEGFTLIELMVVVLIIAILIAIAIPTFLGAQNRARDRGAQSDLRNALTAAKTIATDDAGLFTNVTVANLTTAEGALVFDTMAAAAADTTKIGVLVDPAPAIDTAIFAKGSASGSWFGIGTNSNGVVTKCKQSTAAAVDTYAECVAVAGSEGGSNW